MGWKSKVPVVGALSAVVIGGVAMTVPAASAAPVPTTDAVSVVVQQIGAGGEQHEGRGQQGHGQRGHRAMRGAAVAEELGIEVDTFRDAVKAVIEARQEAGEERQNPADMTPAERLAARADWIADVSAELGISAAELETAFDTVFEAKLDEAVANGRITQAEADELLAAYDNGTLFDVRQDRRIDALGDRITQLLDNGVIDDAQYDALQAELDDEDLQGFRELLKEYREDNGFEGRGFRGRRGGQDAGVEGISL